LMPALAYVLIHLLPSVTYRTARFLLAQLDAEQRQTRADSF